MWGHQHGALYCGSFCEGSVSFPRRLLGAHLPVGAQPAQPLHHQLSHGRDQAMYLGMCGTFELSSVLWSGPALQCLLGAHLPVIPQPALPLARESGVLISLPRVTHGPAGDSMKSSFCMPRCCGCMTADKVPDMSMRLRSCVPSWPDIPCITANKQAASTDPSHCQAGSCT